MKRGLLLVALLVAASRLAFASLVTVADARIAALNFFKLTTGNNYRVSPVATLKYSRTTSDSTPLFYIFDMSPVRGFVIITATDNDGPIIGYSTESAFFPDFSNSGLSNWLNSWAAELQYVTANNIIADVNASAKWAAYRQGIDPGLAKSTGVAPLCNTTWNQSNPFLLPPVWYNLFCPYDSNWDENAVTGCVATAMAQIMKYWNYPAVGTDSTSYDDAIGDGYQNNYGEQSFNFAHTYFDWADMPLWLDSSSSGVQDSAVSQLMYACGVAVHMDYGVAQTGGSAAYVITALSGGHLCAQQAYVDFFNYNPNTIGGVQMSNYTSAAWTTLIENELTAGRPVQYQGDDANAGGHSWVADGFNSSGQFHMNWGWGGQENGYYAINSLDPGTFDFTSDFYALIGIEPGIIATAAKTVLCAGDSTALAVSGVPNGVTYAWSPAASLSCSTCAYPVARPSSTTTYTATVTNNGQTNAVSVTVYVIVPGLFSYALSDSELCQGGSAILTLPGLSQINITPPGPVTWNDSITATLTPTVTTTFNITSGSTSCGAGANGSVTVHVTPHAPITLSLTNSIICYDNYDTLYTTGLHALAFSPSFDGHLINSSSICLTPGANTVYVVSGITSCGSAFTDSIPVTVHQDYWGVSYTLSKSYMCLGDTSFLSIQGYTGITFNPSTGVSAASGNQYYLSPDTTTLYHFTAYDTACGVLLHDSFTLVVVQPGKASYTLQANVSECPGYARRISLYGVENPVFSPAVVNSIFIDSAQYQVTAAPDSTTTYHVMGQSICGGYDTTAITLPVIPYGRMYPFYWPVICQGDTFHLRFTNLINPVFSPHSGVTAIDSEDFIIGPTSNTVYTISGKNCGIDTASYYYSETVNVTPPGPLHFSYDSFGCPGQTQTVQLYGVTRVQVIPPVQWGWGGDSGMADIYLPPPALFNDTTYELIMTTVCGYADTAFLPDISTPSPPYHLGYSYICPGDTTELTIYDSRHCSLLSLGSDTAFTTDSVHYFLHPSTTTQYDLWYNNCFGYMYNFTVTVLPANQIDFRVGDSDVCANVGGYANVNGLMEQTVHLTPAGNFNWYDSSEALLELHPATTTSYTLTGQNYCGHNFTENFTLYVTPQTGYSLQSQFVCLGSSTQLTIRGFSSPTVSPSTGVTWLNDSVILLSPAVNTTYALKGINCSGYLTTDSIPTKVLPASGMTVSYPTSPLCDGGSDTIFVSEATNVQINPWGQLTLIDSDHTDIIVYPDTITQFVVSGQPLCPGILYQSDTVTIPVIMPHKFHISPNPICPGDSALLTVFNSTNVQISGSAFTMINDSSAWLFPTIDTWYYISGNQTCAPTSFVNDEVLQVDNINPSLSLYDTTLCPGQTAQICFNGAGFDYHWSTGQTSVCITLSQSGQYYVTITDQNSCSALGGPVDVNVLTPDSVIVMQLGDSLLTGTSFTSYQWYNNNAEISGANKRYCPVTNAGTYTVHVETTNGCKLVSAPFVITGSRDLSASADIHIYPNPTEDKWIIEVTAQMLNSICRIYDAEGRCVSITELDDLKSEIGAGLESGVYSIKLSAPVGTYSAKLIRF